MFNGFLSRYARLPFRAVLAGDMFQKKIDDLLSGMPNLFGIVDDSSVAGLDEHGKDHDETLQKVLWVCRQTNLKFNKGKCLKVYRCHHLAGYVLAFTYVF